MPALDSVRRGKNDTTTLGKMGPEIGTWWYYNR